METSETKWKHPTLPLTPVPPTPPLRWIFPPNRNRLAAPVQCTVTERPDGARLRYRYLYQPFRYRLCRVRWQEHKAMSRSRNYPYAMTLRLSSKMETALEDLAYSRRLSRAGTIRRILGRAIAESQIRQTAPASSQNLGGTL